MFLPSCRGGRARTAGVFPEHDAGIDFPGRGCVAIRQQSAKQNGAGLTGATPRCSLIDPARLSWCG